MTDVRIIGLMGYGGAGKSEVKKRLVEHHGFEGPHIKAPIANMTRSLLRDAGVPEEYIDNYVDGDLKRQPVIELGNRTSTEVQQFLGSEFLRDFCYPGFLLDLWLAKADSVLKAGGRVVQESVRFPNEAFAIRDRGGIIIQINRPGVGPLPGGHISEVLPATADLLINNDGSLADLHEVIDSLVAPHRFHMKL